MIYFLTFQKFFATLFSSVHATTPTGVPRPTIAPTGGPQTLQDILLLLSTLTGWMLAFAIVAGAGAIIGGGIMYLISGGSPNRAGIGMKMVIYGLVGIAIAGLAWTLVNVVGDIIFGTVFIPVAPAVIP